MIWFISGIIGMTAGILSGVFGIGGGIVLVPLLMFFLELSQRAAQGTSLAALLLPVGGLAAWQYYKGGHVNIVMACIVAVTLALGAYFGANLSRYIPDLLLKRGFGVLLGSVAIKFLFF